MNTNGQFKTYDEFKGGKIFFDLSLIAFLIYRGHKIKEITTRGQKVFFVFKDVEELERDALSYFNHEGVVDPLTFANTQKSVKSIIARGTM